MKPSFRLRVGLGLLLLGFPLQSVMSIAFEPDHYHEHHQVVGERVSLHGQDGDYHHEGARLELGEESAHPTCDWCAQVGKSPVVLIKRLGLVTTLDGNSSVWSEGAFIGAQLGRQPYQPRAPPRV